MKHKVSIDISIGATSFTQNPVIELSLVNKYFNYDVEKIRIINNINYPKMEDKDLKELNCLEYLILSCNKIISDFGLSQAKNLTHLDLSHNENITNKGISELFQLSFLRLSNNCSITDEGLSKLINMVYVYIIV